MGTVTTTYRMTPDKGLVKLDSNGRIINGVVAVEVVQDKPHSALLDHLQRHQRLYSTALMVTAGFMYPVVASAATGVATGSIGGRNLIVLLQQASFWVGMGITIWGIVEAQLDFPGWRGRIAKGILGYIGILLVPLVFVELQNSLQVDVWSKIDGSMMP